MDIMADSNVTEAGSTSKPLVVADLTYDQFCVLFKKLFSESMNELKQEINDKVNELKGECDNKIEAMRTQQNERIEEIKGELHKVRVENEKLIKKNAGLHEELEQLHNESVNNFRGIVEIHQDANRNSLKITGIPESPVKRNPVTGRIIPENTEEVVKNFLEVKMDISIEETDLDSARRIQKTGKQRDTGTPRPIVVNFMRNSTRQKVISNRRCLRGTGIGVHEVLTKGFQYIYDAARFSGVSRGGALGAETPRTRGPEKKRRGEKKKEREGKKERKGEREGKKERKQASDNEKYLSQLPSLNGFQISRHGPIRRTPQQF